MKPKVVIAVNSAWNLYNFRAGLIKALDGAGYDVVAAAPPDKYVPQLLTIGGRYTPIQIDCNGTNPIRDLVLLCRFILLLKRERPSVYLGFTIKPNLYGSVAAQLLAIPVVNNISGLGSAFTAENWLTRLVKCLYKVALARSSKIFFQNAEDRSFFVSDGIVSASQTDLVAGSGVNLAWFVPTKLTERKLTRFLLVARMLRDKGVVEFVDAARLLKQRGLSAEFCLLGPLDPQNSGSITQHQMDSWVAEGVVRYLGKTDDVREEISNADCVVLPSYREGVPRTLLEAAAMARPIIATDVPGCRAVVSDGVNGYLCKAQDASDLAEKISLFAALDREHRFSMGLLGRAKVEREFSEQTVIKMYLDTIGSILDARK